MNEPIETLRMKARLLLESRAVGVVIGYGEGPQKSVRAVFVRDPKDAARLIVDDRCRQNLALYLLKPEVRKMGKPALVARLPVLRTVLQLAAENQIGDKDVTLIGWSEDGRLLELDNLAAAETTVRSCELRLSPGDKATLERIEKMSLRERWAYWREQLARCFKCYACRAACPLCYCSRCTTDCNQPQWIPAAAHDLGNLEWHVMRAMHLAGRCVNCGECARACPLGIPLHLLNQKLEELVFETFGLRPGTGVKLEYPFAMFKPDDHEDFIG
jgi:ferredoxin